MYHECIVSEYENFFQSTVLQSIGVVTLRNVLRFAFLLRLNVVVKFSTTFYVFSVVTTFLP